MSQSLQDIRWARVVAVWLLIISVESLHGIVRTLFLVPHVGDMVSRQVGVLSGSVLMLLISWITASWLALRRGQFLVTGMAWVALTLVYEICLARLLGWSWQRILNDYNPWQGSLLPLGLLILLFAPRIGARLARRK